MRVQLISDDPAKVESVRRVLVETSGVEEAPSSGSFGSEADPGPRQLSPEFVVLDLEIRDHAALEALQAALVAPSQDGHARLTSREEQVFKRLADGQTSKEIAHELGISSKTVDTHRRNLMRKIGVKGIADLVKRAICLGMTTLDPPRSVLESGEPE